jgi:hypothetical protein
MYAFTVLFLAVFLSPVAQRIRRKIDKLLSPPSRRTTLAATPATKTIKPRLPRISPRAKQIGLRTCSNIGDDSSDPRI